MNFAVCVLQLATEEAQQRAAVSLLEAIVLVFILD